MINVKIEDDFTNKIMNETNTFFDITFLEDITKEELKIWGDKIVCIIGPSGVGKHTLCHNLINEVSNIKLIGPFTTRKCDKDEITKNDYKITDNHTFQRKLNNKEFIYWHNYTYESYGIEKKEIRDSITKSDLLLFTFRSRGGGAFKYLMPNITILELRASIDTLKKRIISRKRADIYSTNLRLEEAPTELANNNLMCNYWNRTKFNKWYQIENELESPPIAQEVINEVINILKNIIKNGKRIY